MKYLSEPWTLFLGIILLLPSCGLLEDENSPEATLRDVDSVQAMAIANEWKWSQKEIKSYVTPREVVFEISKGKVKKIPLPKEKMIVAVAPYISKTHT